MPIYEYACADCGQQTELMHKMSEQPDAHCPRCGTGTLVRQVSAAGFRLAGGGWYETDFKNGNKKNLAGEGAAAPAPAKTETAPAAACGSGACAACS
jgi:putative FmdB family regulatory protein